MEVRGAVRVVAVETVARLPAAGPIGNLGGMPVDLVVTGGALRNPAVAVADAARPAIAVAGDAVDRRSVAGGGRGGGRQVGGAGPADAGVGRWGGLSFDTTNPPGTHRAEQNNQDDPSGPALTFRDQHAGSPPPSVHKARVDRRHRLDTGFSVTDRTGFGPSGCGV